MVIQIYTKIGLVYGCLTAPGNYMNPCWLIISKVLWHSPGDNFKTNVPDTRPWYEFENEYFDITIAFSWENDLISSSAVLVAFVVKSKTEILSSRYIGESFFLHNQFDCVLYINFSRAIGWTESFIFNATFWLKYDHDNILKYVSVLTQIRSLPLS